MLARPSPDFGITRAARGIASCWLRDFVVGISEVEICSEPPPSLPRPTLSTARSTDVAASKILGEQARVLELLKPRPAELALVGLIL